MSEQLTEERVREIVREEIDRCLGRLQLRCFVTRDDGTVGLVDARLDRADIERRTIPRPEDPA